MVIINLLLNNAGNTPYTRPITQKHRFRSKSFCRRGKNIPHVMWHIITFRRWAISPRWSNMKNMENNIDFLDIFIYCVILCPTHLLDWNYWQLNLVNGSSLFTNTNSIILGALVTYMDGRVCSQLSWLFEISKRNIFLLFICMS